MTGTHPGTRSTTVGGQGGGTAGTNDESVTGAAQSAASTAADKVKGTGSELTHMASDRVNEAAHQLASKADERRTSVADQARSVQDKARDFAENVREEQPKLGDMLDQLVDSAGRLISYVERTPVEDMTQDLNVQMRRHPALFAAGMFGIGFAASRVVRPISSSSSSTGGTRQVEPMQTQQLPAASALDGGMH